MVGTPGAFNETVQGIRNALASGLHTITNTTVTRENQDHVLDTIRFVHDLGLTTFAMNGIIYAGGGTATLNAIPAEEMAALLAAVRDEAETLGMRFLWYTVTDYCKLSPLALGLAPNVAMLPSTRSASSPTAMFCLASLIRVGGQHSLRSLGVDLEQCVVLELPGSWKVSREGRITRGVLGLPRSGDVWRWLSPGTGSPPR